MTTYTPGYVAREIYLDEPEPRVTTSCHIDTDEPGVHVYTVSFSDRGESVARHVRTVDTTEVQFLPYGNGDPLRADLVALAERTVRAHFDGELL